MVECVYDETKIGIGIEWLSFNRCVTITNISTLITHRLEFAIRISVFSIKYPPSAMPSTIHCHLSMLLPMLPLIPNRKSTTCDYRFCAYVHTYSRILTIFIYTQTFWLSIEFLGAFLPSLGLLLCILLSLSLYPLVAFVAWNISIKLPQGLCGKRNLLNFIWLKQQ